MDQKENLEVLHKYRRKCYFYWLNAQIEDSTVIWVMFINICRKFMYI